MFTPMFTAFHGLLHFLGTALASFYDLVPNYGIAIILLTIATRVVLLPLTIKQTRSMQEMQRIQPEMKKLQAKYKGGDKQKLNEEMMKLYKEHHVNPLGGCLPLLLQLPIFLALYRVFDGCNLTMPHSKTCVAGHVGLKYLPHTSALHNAILTMKAGFLGMNLGVSPVATLHQGLIHALPDFVLVFLMVATTWYQQKQIMAVSTGQQAQQMQMMGKIMPIFLGVFSLELAAGISIYWVASNIWTIGQQAIVLGKPLPAIGGGPATTTATRPGGSGPAAGGAKDDAGKASGGKAPSGANGKAGARPAANQKASVKAGVKPAPRPGAKPAQGGVKPTSSSGQSKGGQGGGQKGVAKPKGESPSDAPASGDGDATTSTPSNGSPGSKPTVKENGKGRPNVEARADLASGKGDGKGTGNGNEATISDGPVDEAAPAVAGAPITPAPRPRPQRASRPGGGSGPAGSNARKRRRR
jgi:YidC/Oxa1 family membrane protein insertase